LAEIFNFIFEQMEITEMGVDFKGAGVSDL
jgi:hypothetical protein